MSPEKCHCPACLYPRVKGFSAEEIEWACQYNNRFGADHAMAYLFDVLYYRDALEALRKAERKAHK